MKSVYFLMLCLLLSFYPAVAQFQFVAPKPGSKFHNIDRTIMLREGSLIDASSLQKQNLFCISGSKSGNHAIERVLSEDGKTILLTSLSPFAFDEEVIVTIADGIRKLTGEMMEGYTFNFYTRGEPSAESTEQFEAFRRKMLQEELGIPVETGLKNPPDGPSKVTIDVNINPAPGEIFFHNISLLGLPVELTAIMHSDGDLIFMHESQTQGVNFDINRNGYLTLYNEASDGYMMFDSSYNAINTFKAGNGYITDVHDFQIFPDGHSFIIGLDYQTIDMTVYDPDYSPNATVIGAILQELDASKNVIFEWRSWDYVDIPEALHETLFFGFIDYVHANSIELDTDGSILLSCRNLDQVIKIDRSTGNIIWRLGGVKNEFTFLNDTLKFNYQHDVRRIANGNITLYDNGNYHPVKTSFAKEYRLDEVNKTASKVWAYTHPLINGKMVRGFAMGNVQRLPNGNTLINWGSIYNGLVLGKGSPNVTEVDSAGNIVWEMTLDESDKAVIYRAHRYEWAPCARPGEKSLSEKNITQTTAKVSWSHATNATGYIVFYKSFAETEWSSKNASGNSKVLKELEPGTKYQWYVQSECDSNVTTLSANSAIRKFITLPLKVFENDQEKESLIVFPNPAGEWITAAFATEEKFYLEMTDLFGKRYSFHAEHNGGEYKIDLDHLTPGMYLLHAIGDNKKFVEKIVVLSH